MFISPDYATTNNQIAIATENNESVDATGNNQIAIATENNESVDATGNNRIAITTRIIKVRRQP